MEDTHIDITRDQTAPIRRQDESFPCSTRRRGSRRRKGVLASVTLMVGGAAVVCMATLVFLSVFNTSQTSHSKPGQGMTSQADDQSAPLHIEKREQGVCPEELCLTKECVHAASSILKFIDESVDPCDDFYRYACGGWMKENEHQVAGENFVYSFVFNVLTDNIDTTLKELLKTGGDVPEELLQTKPYEDLFLFYERCREVESGTQDMTPAHEALQGLDQFQVGKPFESSSWDLTRALLQLLQVNGAPLFDVMIDSDVQEVDTFALVITSPRKFGLISRLMKYPLHRRNFRGLQEFVRARGKRMLFGDAVDEAVKETMPGDRTVPRARGRDTHTRHALHRDAVGNIVSAGAGFTDESTVTPQETSTTSTTSTSSTTSPSYHTSTSTPHHPHSSSTAPTTHHTTTPHATTTTTTHTSTTTDTTTHHTLTSTDLPPASTTTATTTTTTSEAEEDKEESEAGDQFWTPEFAVSRRIIYHIYQESMDNKRLKNLATALHDTFPNASVFSSSSSSSSSPPDGDMPDDAYTEAMAHFLPILQKLLPAEREQLEIQQQGKQYNHFTITALHQLCPVIDWSMLLGALLNTTITVHHNIYVHYPDHLTKLCTLLDNTEPWVIHYALLTLYSYDVLQETVYATDGIEREDFCLQAVKSVFGEVMSNLYLHHIGNDTLKEIKTTSSSIMELLREEVEEIVSASEWLRKEDKEKALKKLHSLSLKVGAREKHWDISFVNESHAEVSLQPNASFLHTVLGLYRTFRHQLYELHHHPIESDDFIWSFTVQPYVVDAFYAMDINSIVFPEAFFHPPYHRHRTPHYINFGSTATSMAHEIFHALDFLGVQFDENGLLTRPFSEEMIDRLNTTSECYHALLSDAFFELRYMHHTMIAFEIDNMITKNENLADISGLRTAFNSYRRWEEREGVEPGLPALPLTPHQLFFVSAALPYCSVISDAGKILLMELDEHLPNELRINGMMKNTPEFAQTFSCSSTSKMFSANTCHVF